MTRTAGMRWALEVYNGEWLRIVKAAAEADLDLHRIILIRSSAGIFTLHLVRTMISESREFFTETRRRLD